jgi:class 3 adenylate cyclase
VDYRHQDRAQPVALRALPAIASTFTDELPSFDEPVRVVRTVLVVDVVESVRLMQEDEAGTVRRWRAFVDYVVNRLLPDEDGRLVKSLGDGLMLECARVGTAVSLALAMQAAMGCLALPNRRLHLRIGIHVSPLIADALDVYGHGVNLAARLTTLAGPGEIVVSADVRDQLTPALDADVEDLGECYVKHLAQPNRVRIDWAGRATLSNQAARHRICDRRSQSSRSRRRRCRARTAGTILADEVISALSRSPDLRRLRLSTTAFGRNASAEEVGRSCMRTMCSGTYHGPRPRFRSGELARPHRPGGLVKSEGQLKA